MLKKVLNRLSSPRIASISRVSSFSFSQQPSIILQNYTPHVRQILLNEPKTRNALSYKLVGEFHEAIDKLKADKSVRAVVVRSAVPGMFCAGANLKQRLAMETPEQALNFIRWMRKLGRNLFLLQVPTIAAIQGAALGGGLELALTCDLRVCSQETLLGLPETGLAIIPGLFGTQLLSYAIGAAKAKELIFLGKLIKGLEAQNLGLVNHVVPQQSKEDKQSDQVIQWARDTAERISERGPVGERMTKKAINIGFFQALRRGLEIEWDCYNKLLYTEDRTEGLRAFAEKRKPVYQGK